MSSFNQNKQHLLGKLTLLAYQDQEKPLGDIPTNEELALLVEDKLSFNRKQEIQSHLNCNPVIFQQWLNLLAITTNTTEQTDKKVAPPSQIKRWLSSWQGIVSGLTCATLATILLVQLVDTQAVNLQPNIVNQTPSAAIKSKQPAATSKQHINKPQFISPDKRAIAAGIQNIVNQKNMNENVNNIANKGLGLTGQLDLSIAIDQQGSALTETLYQDYFHLGQLITTIAYQCQDQHRVPVATKQTIKQLLNKISKESHLPLSPSLQDISKNTISKTAQCDAIKNYLLVF